MCDQDKSSENSDAKPESSDEECEEDLLAHTCFLLKAFEKQFLNENTSDMVLIVEKERFYIHKIVLAARSEYFNALFYGDLKESKQTEIELHETAAEPFKLLLKYAYSSKIKLRNLKVKIILETLELARRYTIENLEIGIYNYFEEKTSEFSVADICLIWDHAITFQMAILAKVCVNFAENNTEEILDVESFLNLSAAALIEIVALDSFCAEEIIIFRAVQTWIEQNKPENAENILCHIRLPLIATPCLVKEVRSSALFSDSALLSAVDTQIHWKYEEINYRKLQIVGKNLASEAFGAKVISGQMPQFLLDGDSSIYDKDRGYTWHPFNDKKGITIRFTKPYRINSIRMLLWDVDDRFFSFYINVSVDGVKWFTVINNKDKPCKSWQTFSFPPTIAKFIRIVGTHSSKNNNLYVVSFECSFNDKLQE